MVAFFGFVIIGAVIGWIIAFIQKKGVIDKVVAGGLVGMVLGFLVSFWGGSFVEKEIVVEKYFILTVFFDGKPIVALMEEHDSSVIKTDNYIFQIKEGDKTKLIKHYLKKEEIFFSNEDEERRLEIKRSKTCRGNMWVWFFYSGTGIIGSKAVLKKGDSFLTLPRYYSL